MAIKRSERLWEKELQGTIEDSELRKKLAYRYARNQEPSLEELQMQADEMAATFPNIKTIVFDMNNPNHLDQLIEVISDNSKDQE